MVPFAAFVDHLRNGCFRWYLAQNSLIQSLLRGTHWCCLLLLLAMAMKLYQVEEEEAWMSGVELNSHNLLYCFVLVYLLPADIPACLDWVLIDRALVLNLTRIIICAYLHPAIVRTHSLTCPPIYDRSMDGWIVKRMYIRPSEMKWSTFWTWPRDSRLSHFVFDVRKECLLVELIIDLDLKQQQQQLLVQKKSITRLTRTQQRYTRLIN